MDKLRDLVSRPTQHKGMGCLVTAAGVTFRIETGNANSLEHLHWSDVNNLTLEEAYQRCLARADRWVATHGKCGRPVEGEGA